MQKFKSGQSKFGKNRQFSNRSSNSSTFGNGGGRRRSFSNNRSSRRGETIDISRFIQKATVTEVTETEAIEIKNSFEDYNLNDELKVNLKKKGYTVPTPIQDQSIKHILDGKDLVGLANTGTGKTGAFLLPLIDKISRNKNERALIIAPTRELALQIENELREFSYGMKIFYASCVGGLSIYHQISNLKRKPHIVIGTPGRLKDLNERGYLDFSTFGNIVLDEVDRMLDMGFIIEIKSFLKMLPQKRQSLFFSATIPPKIRELVQGFLNNPIMVEVKSRETTTNIEQDVIRIAHKDMKFDKLQDLLNDSEFEKVLVFSETKRDVEKLTMSLIKEGFKAESIHGDKRQSQRQRALKAFKDNVVRILVATDVAARGLDIKNVTHVINYTVPQTYDDYIHRIGRTGRAGNKGKALTFIESR